MQTFAAPAASRIPSALALRGASPMPYRRSSDKTAGLRLTFAKGEELFGEGGVAGSFYKVVSGTVRACKLLSDGRRQIDTFYFVGDMFGLEAGQEHRFAAEAVDDVTVIAFRRNSFSSLTGDDPAFGDQLMAAIMSSLDRAHDHMVLLGRKTAQEKVAAFLLDMAGRLAQGDRFALPMCRVDIADHLGLTIETVSRTLTQMAREGLIKLDAGRTVTLTRKLELQQLDS